MATRLFLKRLKRELNIPVMGLVDSDPYGLKILSVYMSGEGGIKCYGVFWFFCLFFFVAQRINHSTAGGGAKGHPIVDWDITVKSKQSLLFRPQSLSGSVCTWHEMNSISTAIR